MCDDCTDTPVCNTCISTTHKGHNCTELEIAAEKIFPDLLEYKSQTTCETIPAIKKKVQAVVDQVTKVERFLQQGIKNAEKRDSFLK